MASAHARGAAAALAPDPTRDGLAMPAVPAPGAFSPYYDPEVRHTPQRPRCFDFFVCGNATTNPRE